MQWMLWTACCPGSSGWSVLRVLNFGAHAHACEAQKRLCARRRNCFKPVFDFAERSLYCVDQCIQPACAEQSAEHDKGCTSCAAFAAEQSGSPAPACSCRWLRSGHEGPGSTCIPLSRNSSDPSRKHPNWSTFLEHLSPRANVPGSAGKHGC